MIRFIDLFLYTSLLTACCATGLCMATEKLINNSSLHLFNSFHGLVFGSTMVVYNVPPLVWKLGSKGRTIQYSGWHILFSFAGALMTAFGLYKMSLNMIVASGVLGIFAFAYFLPVLPFKNKKRLRDFGWLKIIVLASVWTTATSALPILYAQKDITAYPLEILLRLLFIFTLCVIFDIRDMQTDHRNNIHTLPQKVGIKNSYRLINTTLILFVAVSALQYFRFHEADRLISALLTAIITRAVVTYLHRRPSDRAYLLLADGVMLVYALLVIIP